MTSDAERRLAARGVEIIVQDLERDDEPDIKGFLVLYPEEGGAQVSALVSPDASDGDRQSFAQWIEEKIDRFFEHGPEPDGWQERTVDDGWQLWARHVVLPPLD